LVDFLKYNFGSGFYLENGNLVESIGIKSSTTINNSFFKGLNFYKNLNENSKPFLVYGGNDNMQRKEAQVVAWSDTKNIMQD